MGAPDNWGVRPQTDWYTGAKEPLLADEDQSLRVLIVEDDRDGRQLYVEWLEQAGFRVAQAHNGLQALERAVENAPDVVVTDLNIPGIDGFELTRRLKRDSRTRDVPVLAVTGYAAFAADPGRARRAGCDAVLEKPCSADDLETAIRRLVDGSGRPRQV